ncbi:pectin acetylesterase-family hydrolase [Bacteriovoracales bacterium]|nr:pectin acetylesterase-family hydrolase [Bacteriovoracales bacterium]
MLCVKNVLILLFGLFMTINASFGRGPYRDYEVLTVPGAFCGNGDAYKIFIDKKRKSKWAFEFRPGGVCWDKKSCFGVIPHAFPLFPSKFLFLKSVYSRRKKSQNFLAGHGHVIFPYCTADVYAGTHRTYYGDNEMIHFGRTNVEKSLKLLADIGYLDWSKVKDLFVYGSSAGAFGTLVHLPTFDKLMPKDSSLKRTLIIDSAGMHFGEKFWEKFSPDFRKDFSDAFSRYGIKTGLESGNLARFFPPLCEKFSHWNVGVIQGSRDIVMSRFFGDISISDHEDLVFSPNGIYQSTIKPRNCSSWISRSNVHAYLFFSPFRWVKIDGLNPYDYTKKVYRGRRLKNFVSKSLKKEFSL